MTCRLILAALFSCLAASAEAHFVFVVPTSDGTRAQVVLSEDLDADTGVDAASVDPAKLWLRDATGKDVALSVEKGDEAREIKLTLSDAVVVHGACEFGVTQRGDSPPFLLVYHPKTVLGDAFNQKANLGDGALVELLPTGKPGDLKFQLVAKGKPVAGSELTVILPDGNQQKVITDAQGQTTAFKALGRYGVWARSFESTSGDHNGKHYEQVRRYPTLVIDVVDGTEKSATVAPAKEKPAQLAPLPEATSSFGGVACDGWLYVYGGHIAPTHTYSTEAVSGRFHRLNLADGKTWEELAGGPGLQGMNLAACGGKIYRVGGMEPRNKPEEETDNHSIADCACFDPASGKWQALPPLPVPRSSHDVAVVDNRLYVIGGWNMLGDEGEEWFSEALVMDLSAEKPEWKSFPQPFERRALTVAINNGRIYVLGGFPEEASPRLNVDIYDTASATWSSGPELPGRKMNGFAPAACTVDGRVYVSVADGTLYRLNEAAGNWQRVASTTPRIVHRLAPHGSKILVVGGAAKGDNLNLVEVVELSQSPRSGNASE